MQKVTGEGQEGANAHPGYGPEVTADQVLMDIFGGDLLAEKTPVVMSKPTWEVRLRTRASIGYKDNVFYSAFDPQSSPLGKASLDLLAVRDERNLSELSVWLFAEHTTYTDLDPNDNEELVMATVEWRRWMGSAWNVTMNADYSYVDQFLDTSTSDQDLGTNRIQEQSIALTPSVGRDLGGGVSGKVGLTAGRTTAEDDGTDYDTVGAEAALRLSYGRSSAIQLVCRGGRRTYSDREQSDLEGYTLSGTDLEFGTWEAALENTHTFGRRSAWRARTRAGWIRREDNGSGYYDYDRYLLGESLRFRHAGWTLQAKARWSVHDYSSRPAAPGVDTDKLHRAILTASLDAEMALGPRWALGASYSAESQTSNEEASEYDVTTALVRLGLSL